MLVPLTCPLMLTLTFGVVFLPQDDGKDKDKGKGQGQPVTCQVEKGGTILSLLPDRSLVKKGDVVCELDSADLKDRLVEQTIAARRAETQYQAARPAHELAGLALKQYKDSSYLLEKGAIWVEIKRAEANLTSTADQFEQTTRDFEKGRVTKAQKVAVELNYQKTKYDLELAQSKLKNLEDYAKPIAVQQLESEVEKTRSQEKAAKEISELRQSQVERTRRQIESCKLVAPCDGRLILAPRPPRPGELEPVPLQPGDIVRERQEVAGVIPATP